MKTSWPAIALTFAATAMIAPAAHAATKAIVGATVVNIDGGSTIMVTHPGGREYFQRIGSPEWYLKRRESVGKQHWESLRGAIQEGVKIALGTDQMPFEPNDGTTSTVREAEAYVEVGMTPLQALRSTTIESATMLRAQEDMGSLEAGKYADILAVNSDPLKSISALRNIVMIMKGGAVYRNESADSGATGP